MLYKKLKDARRISSRKLMMELEPSDKIKVVIDSITIRNGVEMLVELQDKVGPLSAEEIQQAVYWIDKTDIDSYEDKRVKNGV